MANHEESHPTGREKKFTNPWVGVEMTLESGHPESVLGEVGHVSRHA